MPAKGEKYFFISSIAKGIKTLELLAEKEKLSVSDVAKHLGFDRTGSHRHLATLRELGYVEQDDAHRYQLTSKLLVLGAKYSQRFEIRKMARPYLEKLNNIFNETINLGRFINNDILHIDRVDSTEILRIDSPLGTRAPAYCTALGKAILSVLPSDDLDAYLKQVKLERHGPNTITSPKKLRVELKETLKRGYAIDNEELVAGLCCIGSPVYNNADGAYYAISLSVPKARLWEVEAADGQRHIKTVCRELSEKLGSVKTI
jgi:DNA-binding IclR family transcriptional regulator